MARRGRCRDNGPRPVHSTVSRSTPSAQTPTPTPALAASGDWDGFEAVLNNNFDPSQYSGRSGASTSTRPATAARPPSAANSSRTASRIYSPPATRGSSRPTTGWDSPSYSSPASLPSWAPTLPASSAFGSPQRSAVWVSTRPSSAASSSPRAQTASPGVVRIRPGSRASSFSSISSDDMPRRRRTAPASRNNPIHLVQAQLPLPEGFTPKKSGKNRNKNRGDGTAVAPSGGPKPKLAIIPWEIDPRYVS